MITCPKCQTPNPDNATSCLACGAGLAGQQFAAQLDRATQPPDAAPADAAAPPAAPAEPSADLAPLAPDPAAAPSSFDLPPMETPPIDPAAAQAQINEFVAEQRARKRNKSLIWGVVAVVAVVVIALLAVRSAQKKAKQEEMAKFYLAFLKVDDGPAADFWRCVVRAKHLDVRLAKDNLILTDGLEKAYKNFPKSQPRKIKKHCLPLLEEYKKGLGRLTLPEGFAGTIDGMKLVMDEIKQVFEGYITKLEARAEQTANEKRVMEVSGAFHTNDPSTADKAATYVALMECAVPDLVKMAKKVKKAPDTQKLVEYMYAQCKGDAKAFSDKVRKECIDKLNEVKKPKNFRVIAYKMSGDDRDRSALDYCFKRANRGFFEKDIHAIGKIWVKYREKRKIVLDEIFKHKEKPAGKHGEEKEEGEGEAAPAAAPAKEGH